MRDRYIAEFHEKFTEIAKEKGTAFRRTSRADLDWIFTARNERTVAKDNTVALGERIRQIEKTKFRNSLAGCVVTIHEHLDGRFSIRYGPHVVGRYGCDGKAVGNAERRGKAGPVEAVQNHRQVSHRSHCFASQQPEKGLRRPPRPPLPLPERIGNFLTQPYQATTPFSSKNDAVGPSSPSRASRTGAVAPCATVRWPRWEFRSVAT